MEGKLRLSFDIPRLALLGGDYDEAVEGEGIADLRGTWSVVGRAQEVISP